MPWIAVRAGGAPRKAMVWMYRGYWTMVPVFDNQDECRTWWEKFAKENEEEPPWGIRETEAVCTNLVSKYKTAKIIEHQQPTG